MLTIKSTTIFTVQVRRGEYPAAPDKHPLMLTNIKLKRKPRKTKELYIEQGICKQMTRGDAENQAQPGAKTEANNTDGPAKKCARY